MTFDPKTPIDHYDTLRADGVCLKCGKGPFEPTPHPLGDQCPHCGNINYPKDEVANRQFPDEENHGQD